MWSTLLRKSGITTTFYLSAEKENVCIKKNQVSVNSPGHNLDVKVL